MPINDFVDTSHPHNANDHIRLGEMKRFRKAALGGGIQRIFLFGGTFPRDSPGKLVDGVRMFGHIC
jgi:hypothetical protein